ncbi:uncharacterized protein MYCFIDRAFT_195148 [Pseudocercospora fijiensis CIRAD86]|uniref:Uncharacterized protein n=1 Tax=Pseudocercospora fijiensis (strain CIRAD86) TaxID=383855 RepID=M3B3L3_PSEFD|nr:uncharacterized protein MYCFIDRAFT_195148 [Pseudocercospora fijiensis CIRAD86]EME83962.1 hypothetical protein MYCFIDRAFT_195148 [Pseudocercospora fijiensis CIRAD86]
MLKLKLPREPHRRRLRHQEPELPPMDTMRIKVDEILGKTTVATSDDRVKAQYRRIQRGVLLYETCSSEELQVFCQQRGISLPRSSNRITRRARDDLIKILESADENITFHKYKNLPAELGLLVIEAYMSSVPSSNISATPPPICGVSRSLRHDSMIIFHQTLRLNLSFDFHRGSVDLALGSRSMIEVLYISEVEYIKKYSIRGFFAPDSKSVFTLDISKDGKNYQISKTNEPISDRQKRIAGKMFGQMKASLDGMLAGKGRIVLRFSEVWGWRRMWEMALRDVEDEDGEKHIGSLSGPPAPPMMIGA